MGLLPSRVETAVTPDEPKVLDIEGEDADAAFEALSSSTARRILAAVYDEPRTPVEVREEVGTSLQNVHYHLDKLEDAGLIEPAGTGYSEKGNEMTVYAPASEAVVLFAGREDQRSRLRRVLQRVSVLFLVLVAATLAFSAVYRRFLAPEPQFQAETGDVSVRVGADAGATPVAGGGGGPGEFLGGLLPGLDPAVAFFLGGLVVLAVLGTWWYYRGV